MIYSYYLIFYNNLNIYEMNAKSSWPLWTGLHMCYNVFYKKMQLWK